MSWLNLPVDDDSVFALADLLMGVVLHTEIVDRPLDLQMETVTLAKRK